MKELRNFFGYNIDLEVENHITDCGVKVTYNQMTHNKEPATKIAHGRYGAGNHVDRVVHLVEGKVRNEFDLVDSEVRYHTDYEVASLLRDEVGEAGSGTSFNQKMKRLGKEYTQHLENHSSAMGALHQSFTQRPGVVVISSYHTSQVQGQPAQQSSFWQVIAAKDEITTKLRPEEDEGIRHH